ncbi:hypothetical protein SAMN05421810_103466 [Amycolatopsis arida]|uniref:ABC-2 type transport system permease protein n=1 Tax=Amycolatopsis arida TaxID=587909 RepID=A0A1I5TB15_9PSEU|nr:DUF6297 family protein [Amycolatopsis arida]TDX96155.1 hypothetical protein CLV69_103291 [Amycolatopsis arida]SFP80202.1 hypothetical protein SAMN05421810_103466 [Amycolatopsis arida]
MSARLPGRPWFAGIFTGDTPTLVALFAVGILITAFHRLDFWRDLLLAGSAVPAGAVLGLVMAAWALGSVSLLRRSFVWAEPAALTWLDFADGDRVRTVSGRLWRMWSARLLAIGYVGALLAAVNTLPPVAWHAGAALLVAGAVPVLLAAAGVGWPWSPLRVPVAVRAGRQRLVDGWAERVVRAVAVTFLDPMLMLPAARPVGGRSLRGATVVRLAWLGVLGRARYVGPAVLVAVTVGVAHVALPGLPDAVLVALGGFAALMPFGGGLGELWRSPGLRRWVDGSDRALRVRFAVVIGALAAGWALVLGVVVAALGAPLAGTAWLAVPLAAGTVLRAATRRPLNYANVGATDTPLGQLPVGLAAQAVRGPDLGIVGVLLLAVLPFGWPALVVAAVLTAWCVLF